MNTCCWRVDDIGGDTVHETSCGHAFQFNDGQCAENGFIYCPYCGNAIVEVLRSEEKEGHAVQRTQETKSS